MCNQCLLFLEFLKDPNSPVLCNVQNDVVEIEKAQHQLVLLSRSPDVREEFHAREKALKDRASELFCARAEGEAIGEARGEARGIDAEKINVAKKMLATMTDDMIAQFTELPLETILRLRRESNIQ